MVVSFILKHEEFLAAHVSVMTHVHDVQAAQRPLLSAGQHLCFIAFAVRDLDTCVTLTSALTPTASKHLTFAPART